MRLIYYHIGLWLILLSGTVSVQAQVQVGELRCEQRSDPQGIDVSEPRLSWQISGEAKGLLQTAYQLMVASSAENLSKDKGDLWNSGKIVSGQSILVGYGGGPLKSRALCYWKVKVWTTAGVSDWSPVASWSMGLLDAADWKARWIGYDQGFAWDSISKFSRLSARYFRREFPVAGLVRRAVVYIIGLGHYELYINGSAIGDQVLAEAPTDYTKRLLYNSFDVTAQCRKGMNAVGVVLGNGRFFTMRPRYKPKKIKEFGFPKLLLQLEIEYADGHIERVVSDEHWKFTADGPIRTNNEYDGEEYDATKELKGWCMPGYDGDGWLKPQRVAPPGGRIAAQMDMPVKVMSTVRPVTITQLSPDKWILDMGQNMAGWVKMKVRGTRGQRVILRYGETLQKDGTLYTANLRDARVTDIYTLKGEGEEEWHPVFVFHGFRFVEITGYPGLPVLEDFEGEMLYDNMATTGFFQTDNKLINKIYQNAWWGIASNYKGMPLDCPQRNERMPWLGDRATGSLGESYVFDNGKFYAKWLDDIEDAQRPDGALPDVAPAYWDYYSDNMTWPGTYILVADMLYGQYGDIRPMRRHYASMKKWLNYMKGKYGAGGIMTRDKYGDWCVPPESPELIHARDSTRITDGQLIATAYYYRLLMLMGDFARLLHHPEDDWIKQAGVVKNAFNKRWFNKNEGMYGNNTVTANLLPLYFGMAPQADSQRIFGHIVRKIEEDNKGHISTGVIGTQWLMRGLTRYGRPDLAWRIATNKDYPGWGYMVEHGATTIWELWNGDSANPAMNSHNHVMLLGDLVTWMYEEVAGISPGAPGFRKIVMHPAVMAAGQAEAAYHTPYGLVKSNWKKEGEKFIWDITVPGNTQATVYLPDGKVEEVGSGSYHYEVNHDEAVADTAQQPSPEANARSDSAADKKAAGWIASLHLNDPAKEARLVAVVSTHLKAVRNWNNSHPYMSVPAGIVPATGKPLSVMDRRIIANSAMPKTVHEDLMKGLRKDITQEQVDAVLDKYTVGKVAFTMAGYKAIVPDLTPGEETAILANLQLAREQAVDYKDTRQMSAIFEIYKTKNEHYLDANGRNWYALYKAYADAQKAKKNGVIASQFIFENAPFPECHAATIAETPEGLVAAWFGGTKERNPDVCIYVSRKEKGQQAWTVPVNVANGIKNDTLRYACWNPVLYQVAGGDLLLFYKVGPSPAKWKGWLIRSKDGALTWSAPWALPEGFLGPIKNKPALLKNGMLICPSSTEGNGWKVHFELTPDAGKTWQMSGEPVGGNAIQPSILFHEDGSLQALCRSQNRAILETWSKDMGLTWSPLTATSLPNNNSGTDAVTLADGRQLLVYNHVLPPPGMTKGDRSPLNVAISPDGKAWYAALVLENDTAGQYSYPSVIQSSDGMVHIVYTWRRKKIKYVELDPSKLKLEKIVDGVWPASVKK